ncbi:MAG TPA: hypothetical protein VMV40_05700 [Acidiferrobacter sp.]|nr:hypothetical protein [Acidiferrobacter sp.]
MTNAWKQWDFSGAGLQTLNLELTKRLRKQPLAYGLWVLFPLGLHAFYLRERYLGWVYLATTALLIGLTISTPWPYPTTLAAAMVAAALVDVATLGRRLTAYNKALRIALLLQRDTQPPPGYRGRYADEDTDIRDYLAVKDQEQAGHSVRTAPPADRVKTASFNQQEAALRALMAREKRPKSPRS